MRKLLLALLYLPAACLWADPFGMDTYTQKFEIVFNSEEAAARAKLQALPLYHGFDQAFSTRWDDNHMDALKVRDVMRKHGQKGTFFLNESQGYTAPAESGVTLQGNASVLLAPALREGGNSIGAHSLSHEFVPYLNRNRQFYEVMGCRADREVNSQSPVVAYAFSFMSVRNELEGGPSQEDFAEILKRSGFYLLCEHPFAKTLKSDFLIGTLICGDGGGSAFGEDFESDLQKARPEGDKPLWAVSMHPWVAAWGGKDFPLLEALYKKWSGKKDWWYCNQNEYAAYRWQFLNSRVEAAPGGKVLQVTVTRPDPLDLGDLIPLSFVLKGVRSEEVKELRGGTVKPRRFERGLPDYTFDLPHGGDHGLPQAYGPPALGIEASLSFAGNQLQLRLRNPSEAKIENIRVVFRLPLKWKEGVVKKALDGLWPGENKQIVVTLTPATSDYLYTDDKAYCVAQMDAVRNGKRVRDYATCFEEPPPPDASYPKGGFKVLGPLAAGPDKLDVAAWAEKILKAPQPENCYSFGKSQSCWQAPTTALSDQLGPEIITAGGKNNSRTFYTWDKALYTPGPDPLFYLLWGKVGSPRAGTFRAVFDKPSVKAIYLNGKEVKGDELRFKKGMNDLRLLYSAGAGPYSSFSPNHFGAWFRILDEKGVRFEGIKYQLPDMEEPGIKKK